MGLHHGSNRVRAALNNHSEGTSKKPLFVNKNGNVTLKGADRTFKLEKTRWS